MMFTCTTRFEIEDEQLAFIRSLSIHEEGEIDEPSDETEGFEPISDTEDEVDKVDELDEIDVSRLSSVRAGKRRKSVLSDESDDDLFPLPIMPESQIRASGRVKKRPRGLEGYESG